MNGLSSDFLTAKPSFTSKWPTDDDPPYLERVVEKVHSYFQDRWPWTSLEKKEAYAKYDMESCGALLCPNAPEDRAELVCTWNTFFFIYDDMTEAMGIIEAKESVARLNEVMMGRETPEGAIESIMHDLRSRILSFGGGSSTRRAQDIFDETHRFLIASSNHQEREKCAAQGLDKYMEFRILEIGFAFTKCLVFWELDMVNPTPRLSDDLTFRSLEPLAGAHMLLVNDMYSYRWELKQFREWKDRTPASTDSNTTHAPHSYILYNAVCAILQEGVGVSDVMVHLGNHITDHEIRFQEAVEGLRSKYWSSSKDLKAIDRFSNALISFMTGNIKWSASCRRYNTV